MGIEGDPRAAKNVQRVKEMKKAQVEILKANTSAQVRSSLISRNGPDAFKVLTLPLRSKALVWIENKKS